MSEVRGRQEGSVVERAGSILLPALKRLGIEEGVRLERIRTDWDSLFAKPLSAHMFPSTFLDGELLIAADSPIWMHQLNFLRNEIMGKLSPYGVRKLRFRVGRMTRKKEGSKEDMNRPGKGLSEEDSVFIRNLVSGVGDEELRSAIMAAAEKSLLRKGGPQKA
jgi:hypothetical protein